MALIHQEPHPKVGQEVDVISGPYEGMKFKVEDWWDRIADDSWLVGRKTRNPLCLSYGMMVFMLSLPDNDEVIVGDIAGKRLLIHETQTT